MVRIGTWNTEWAKPGTAKGDRVGELLAEPDCDILCVTEGYAEILPDGGQIIDAGPDWGYPAPPGRRKVLLWSKQPWSGPWSDFGSVPSSWFPEGRFVGGITQTDVGPIVVVGACIPWSGAHVYTGRRNRIPWEDHERWLAGFRSWRNRQTTQRTIVLGDFNQCIPRKKAPYRTHELLLRAFDGFTFATAGELSGAPGLAIDHIAHTPDLLFDGRLEFWPRRSKKGEPLPDHFGIRAKCRPSQNACA